MSPASTSPSPGRDPLVAVDDLHVEFPTNRGVVRAVTGVSFSLGRGETVGIVGESGSGKSATALALLGLHRGSARVHGSVRLDGQELVGASDGLLRSVRGGRAGMIFQDPLSALHPHYRVGDQIIEAYRTHRGGSKRAARRRAVELLEMVRIPRADRRVDDYPHQFSGGMRQRIMIAMALSCRPDLLVADEPTTALDVTTQAEVLGLLRDLQAELGMAIVLITHDLGVVGEMADQVVVMYAGRVVEQASVESIFSEPGHPYTWGLLGSLVSLDRPRPDRLLAIPGQPPSLVNPPTGCAFHPRCPHAETVGAACQHEIPLLLGTGAGGGTGPGLGNGGGRRVACHLPVERRAELRPAGIGTTSEEVGS
ncbi:MAG TPA: ABC transporter ATP-binding protein [Acidimicrobiales bacterium]|nr:ABC transporter ATP-binding protein [Acidimicrobiales bacterium]